ncbi:MAG: dipeptidase PepV [Longicatena sp.]
MNYLDELEKYKDDFMNDLKGLIAIRSIRDDATSTIGAPFGTGCKEALDYMLALGKREGFVTKNIDGYACVIEYGQGSESVGVLAHLDIVPVGDDWSKDPFGCEVVNGYLFGRGVMDDKGPAMTAFYALKMLRDQNIKLNKKIMLILGCDEESGMDCMNYYVKHAEVPSVGFTPDASFPVIYGEKGGLHVSFKGKTETNILSMHAGERINVVIGKAQATLTNWKSEYADLFEFYLATNALVGNVEVNGNQALLSIEGRAAHAAMPYLGVNAALHILNFVGGCYQEAFARDTYTMLKDWLGLPVHIDIDGAYMGFLTMNTGIVDIEDGNAELNIDIRYPNDASVETIMNGFYTTAKELNYPLDIVLEHDTKPLFVDPNSNLVTTLSNVYRKYSKDEVTPNLTIGGGTYAKKFPNFVAFGPEFSNEEQPKDMFIGGCHQKDEAIKLDNLYIAMAIYTEAMAQLAK